MNDTNGKALRLLNVLREAAYYESSCDQASVPGESEPGEFYITWDDVDFAVRVEVM